MNILYIADGVSLSSGVGDLVHVKEVVKILSKEVFKITLLIRSGKNSDESRIENLTCMQIPTFSFPWSVFSYLIGLFSIIATTVLLKPTIIYVRDTGINLGVIIGRLFRVPVILELNGDLSKDYSKLARPIAFIFSYLMGFTYCISNRVIVPSMNMVNLLREKGVIASNVFHVPNGVNPEYFYPIDKTMCRKKLNLDGSSFYFCFVGNLAPWQGIDKAIIAFAKLLNEKPGVDAKLLIAGTGPLRKKLDRLASDLKLEKKIIFLGSVAHELVPYVICASDVCIAPFPCWRNMRIGLSPLKLFEYLSCGRPVIVSSIPGTEIVKQLGAGIIVKPDDIEDLKDAYEKAMQTFLYFEQRESVISNTVAVTHSWRASVDDIMEIVCDLVNES